MKLGDIVKVPDGRIGTVVYSGLDGFGIKWGKHLLLEEDRSVILGLNPLFEVKTPEGYNWFPDAMLRDKDVEKLLQIECVGNDKLCEILPKADEQH